MKLIFNGIEKQFNIIVNNRGINNKTNTYGVSAFDVSMQEMIDTINSAIVAMQEMIAALNEVNSAIDGIIDALDLCIAGMKEMNAALYGVNNAKDGIIDALDSSIAAMKEMSAALNEVNNATDGIIDAVNSSIAAMEEINNSLNRIAGGLNKADNGLRQTIDAIDKVNKDIENITICLKLREVIINATCVNVKRSPYEVHRVQSFLEGIYESLYSTAKGMNELIFNPTETIHNIRKALSNPSLIKESISQEFMKNVVFGDKNTDAKFAGRLFGDTFIMLITAGGNESGELSRLSKVKNLDELEDINRVAKGAAKAKIPRTGAEWNEYFKSKYGSGNVEWVTELKSYYDITMNPKALWGKSADDVGKILGEGWTRGTYGSAGNGWKFTNGDKSVFYHPGEGVHEGSYIGVSSAEIGKVKVVGPDYKPLPGDKATIIQK